MENITEISPLMLLGYATLTVNVRSKITSIENIKTIGFYIYDNTSNLTLNLTHIHDQLKNALNTAYSNISATLFQLDDIECFNYFASCTTESSTCKKINSTDTNFSPVLTDYKRLKLSITNPNYEFKILEVKDSSDSSLTKLIVNNIETYSNLLSNVTSTKKLIDHIELYGLDLSQYFISGGFKSYFESTTPLFFANSPIDISLTTYYPYYYDINTVPYFSYFTSPLYLYNSYPIYLSVIDENNKIKFLKTPNSDSSVTLTDSEEPSKFLLLPINTGTDEKYFNILFLNTDNSNNFSSYLFCDNKAPYIVSKTPATSGGVGSLEREGFGWKILTNGDTCILYPRGIQDPSDSTKDITTTNNMIFRRNVANLVNYQTSGSNFLNISDNTDDSVNYFSNIQKRCKFIQYIPSQDTKLNPIRDCCNAKSYDDSQKLGNNKNICIKTGVGQGITLTKYSPNSDTKTENECGTILKSLVPYFSYEYKKTISLASCYMREGSKTIVDPRDYNHTLTGNEYSLRLKEKLELEVIRRLFPSVSSYNLLSETQKPIVDTITNFYKSSLESSMFSQSNLFTNPFQRSCFDTDCLSENIKNSITAYQRKTGCPDNITICNNVAIINASDSRLTNNTFNINQTNNCGTGISTSSGQSNICPTTPLFECSSTNQNKSFTAILNSTVDAAYFPTIFCKDSAINTIKNYIINIYGQTIADTYDTKLSSLFRKVENGIISTGSTTTSVKIQSDVQITDYYKDMNFVYSGQTTLITAYTYNNGIGTLTLSPALSSAPTDGTTFNINPVGWTEDAANKKYSFSLNEVCVQCSTPTWISKIYPTDLVNQPLSFTDIQSNNRLIYYKVVSNNNSCDTTDQYRFNDFKFISVVQRNSPTCTNNQLTYIETIQPYKYIYIVNDNVSKYIKYGTDNTFSLVSKNLPEIVGRNTSDIERSTFLRNYGLRFYNSANSLQGKIQTESTLNYIKIKTDNSGLINASGESDGSIIYLEKEVGSIHKYKIRVGPTYYLKSTISGATENITLTSNVNDASIWLIKGLSDDSEKDKLYNGANLLPVTNNTITYNTGCGCQYSDWVSSGSCNKTTGKQAFTRTVIATNGNTCTDLSKEDNCAVNCEVSDWSIGSCDPVTGTTTDTRSVTVTAKNGGTACPVLTRTSNCDVNCVVTRTPAVDECSTTTNQRTTKFNITTPSKNNGKTCPTVVQELYASSNKPTNGSYTSYQIVNNQVVASGVNCSPCQLTYDNGPCILKPDSTFEKTKYKNIIQPVNHPQACSSSINNAALTITEGCTLTGEEYPEYKLYSDSKCADNNNATIIPYSTLDNSSSQLCYEECNANTSCKGFNYNDINKKCELYDLDVKIGSSAKQDLGGLCYGKNPTQTSNNAAIIIGVVVAIVLIGGGGAFLAFRK